ncbi:hypothetical protein SAMN05660657_04683 [Geodermatophilus amargosae]|uniref:Uncharacterized protein n=1 Tax=Geodermatophilus amargosae TaxID=1296565 RepID=A0A1I7CNF9_9ACTN|nr:hypothetical protein SAMN05660657_04683 [Geodermatophilus amargosae]
MPIELSSANRQAHESLRVPETRNASARMKRSRTGPMNAEAGGGLHRRKAAEQTE